MGRKAITNKELATDYNHIVCYLIGNGQTSADDLVSALGITKGRLSKALQYGRRSFPESIPIENLVLASPNGYFIPEEKESVIAWYVQYKLFGASLAKTIEGVGNYLKDKFPEELTIAEAKIKEANEDENDPWSIFNILNNGGF